MGFMYCDFNGFFRYDYEGILILLFKKFDEKTLEKKLKIMRILVCQFN